MSKKQRKIGNRVNGFIHTLAHLMNLKENFEAHHDVFQREIELCTFAYRYLTMYDTHEDLHRAVHRYMRNCNNYRYTECLNGLSPNEYRKAA